MEEEVKSKAAAVSSIANRLERRGARGPTRAPRIPIPRGSPAAPVTPSAAKKGAALFHLSRYRATTRLTGSTRRGGVIRTNHRSMISNRQLAQNEKRKSEHDPCRDDGSDLGKRRCTFSRSKFRCLIPPARTKNVHVGLHLATATRAGAASPRKWEHRCEEIIAP
jgi:hypothetical protein